VILVGTLFPFFSSLFTDQKIELTADYFTKITGPFGLILLLLLGLCPYLLRHSLDKSWRVFGGALTVLAAVGGWFWTKSLAAACFVICAFAALNLAVDFLGLIRQRDENGVISGPRRSLRWYGARIAHIGVVLVFLGIAGSGAYDIEKQAALRQGQSMRVGKYIVKFEGLKAEHGPNFTAVTAEITVYKSHRRVDPNDEGMGASAPAVPEPNDPNISVFARLRPSQAYYHRSDERTSEVDIERSFAGDFYAALTKVDNTRGLINLRVLVKPLINWIWIGSSLAVLGACLALASTYLRRKGV
jgi:cytochrome c-type biogenesis protein CcmF